MSKVAILLSTSSSPSVIVPNTLKYLLTILQVCKTALSMITRSLKNVFSKVDILTLNGECPNFGSEEEVQSNKHTHLQNLNFVDYTKIDLDQQDYVGLIVPDGIGHYHLPKIHHKSLKSLIYSFAKFKKPICMIGTGCAALLATAPDVDEEWMFRYFSLTSPSNMEDVQENKYGTIPSLEEFIHLNYGHYAFSRRDGPHTVVDNFLVTAQKKNGTLIALQTFILLCNL